MTGPITATAVRRGVGNLKFESLSGTQDSAIVICTVSSFKHQKQAKTLYNTLKLLADVFRYWVALWSIRNDRIGPGSGKPKTASALLQLMDVEIDQDGSKYIYNT